MKKILIDSLSDFFKTAIVENGELVELLIEEKNKKFSVGNIYTGVVKKILPSQFAFINIGYEKNTFLHLTDNKEKSIYEYDKLNDTKKLKIKCGQDIIVQVIKEGTDEKCPVVSSMITLSGKYIVLLFNDNGINISKKISDLKVREKLISIGEKIVKESPFDLGIIMRTNCLETEESVIIEEAKALIKKYTSIVEKGKYTKAPAEIYKNINETNEAIRDLIKNDDDEIIFNDAIEYNNFMTSYNGKGKIILYDSPVPLFDNFFVQKQIEKALHNKIWLKCGGFIVIDYTEACIVIDVNTGKHSGKNHRKTVLKTNIEAAKEIAKQIRLKNLSGIIIIDFIDMHFSEDRKEIWKVLSDEVKKDRVGVTVVGMTELGLMQITRKKVRKPISKLLTCKCPVCSGSGFVFNEMFIADKIKNEILSIFSSTVYNNVVVSSNQRIIDVLKGKNDEYKNIENKFNKKISFEIITTQKLDYYKIEKFVVDN